jgi:hypothetical protein
MASLNLALERANGGDVVQRTRRMNNVRRYGT